MDPQPIKQADVSKLYLENLLLHLDALTIMYRDLLRDYAKSVLDEDGFNRCLTEMVVIMDHLMPKLEGGGKATETLLGKFQDYVPWTENIMVPKAFMDERIKLHALFKLIVRAYDVLGLSRY